MEKRSVTIARHRTSIALEPEFWTALEALARRRGVALAQVLADIDEARGPQGNLASALRVYVLRDLTQRLAQPMAEVAAADTPASAR